MQTTKLQACRREFKYVVDDRTAREIRRFVLAYLEPDAYTDPHADRGYEVHSLYLDSRDLRLCQATLDGLKNRFKLRVRFYDECDASPAYCEIKRRVNDIILKERAAVSRDAVSPIVQGMAADPCYLFRSPSSNTDQEKAFRSLLNFCLLRDEVHAVPAAYTSYLRQGFEMPDSNAVRVTIDQQLRAGVYNGCLTAEGHETWPKPNIGGVVVELKFTDRFPEWMHTLVESFNLLRRGMPKYVRCVQLLRRVAPDMLPR